MIDEQPPEGFNLDAEKSREDHAAVGGIVAREPLDMVDQPPRVDADGTAAEDDDEAIDDPSPEGA